MDARFIIHDHDAKYGGGSDLVFKAEGVEVISGYFVPIELAGGSRELHTNSPGRPILRVLG